MNSHIVWKFLKMSHLNLWILALSTNFCPIKTDLSGNTVWPQALCFQKLAKLDYFWHFKLTFVHSKCECSSLRSQCWMRLFLWFSNSVVHAHKSRKLGPFLCRSMEYCWYKLYYSFYFKNIKVYLQQEREYHMKVDSYS